MLDLKRGFQKAVEEGGSWEHSEKLEGTCCCQVRGKGSHRAVGLGNLRQLLASEVSSP